MIEVVLIEDVPNLGPEHIAHAEFEDPQDALVWLWHEAEQASEGAGPLSGLIDGKPVAL